MVLVNITEQDYDKVFGRKRPLDPLIILRLVQAAITGGARLVAVDIDTEDWAIDGNIIRVLRMLAAPNSSNTQKAGVVWARNFNSHEGQVRREYLMQPFLGGWPSAARECYGLPALAEEAGVVRWFFTGVEVNSAYEPSFVQQILYRSENRSCLRTAESAERRLIAFSSVLHSETAKTLLLESEDSDFGIAAKPYLGKIVILGGSFFEGGDARQTPVGARSGLEITGQAVASALNGESRAEIEEPLSVIIDVAIGLLVVLLGLISHQVQNWSTVGALAVAIVGMWFLWREYYLFLSFVPIFIGLIAHLSLERLFPSERPSSSPGQRPSDGSPAIGQTRHSKLPYRR